MFNKIEKINNNLFVQTENAQKEVIESNSKFGFKGIIEKVKKIVVIPVVAVGITFSSLVGCGSNPVQPDYEARIVELEKENASLRIVVGESDIPLNDYFADLNERVEILENENKNLKAEVETLSGEAVCTTDADCERWEEEQVKIVPKPVTKAEVLSGEMININTATLEELEMLPGVGPKTAQAIIDGRPYGAVEEILEVRGIGDKKFEGMKNNICVDCE